MKRKMKITSLLALTILLVISVSAQTTTYNLTPEESGFDFNKLTLKGAMKVVLIPGDQPEAWIEYQEEEEALSRIQENITFTHTPSDKSLFVKYNNPGNSVLYIQYTHLGMIKSRIAVNLRTEDTLRSARLEIHTEGASETEATLAVDELYSSFSGASSATLKGYADTHHVTTSGATSLKASELITKNMLVDASGVSQLHINVSDKLSGSLSGSSSLKNKRKPKVTELETSGLAKTAVKGDTTKVRIGKTKFLIIDDDQQKIEIENKEKSGRSGKKFAGSWGGFELGFNGYLNTQDKMKVPDEYDFLNLREEKSIVVNINLFEKNFNLIRNRFGLVTGLGLQYNNYRFQSNTLLTGDSARIYGSFDTDPKKNYIKSKLLVKYITLPLMLEYNTGGKNKFHIGAGAQFAWKYGDHSKIVYEESVSREKKKDKGNFYLYPYKLDITARIGWSWINLFATYSLTPMFKEDKGPELYPFSAGIKLASW
ncbi:MAG: DUF2807 domain-containing protein [Bacteroidales bacterium]